MPPRPDVRIAACQALLDRGDESATTIGQMLDALIDAGQFERAVLLAGTNPRTPGHDPVWDAQLARALTRAGRDAKALRHIDAASRNAPGNLSLGLQRFALFARLHRIDEAAALIDALTPLERFRFSPAMIKLLRDRHGAAYLHELADAQPHLFRPGDLLECRVNGLLATVRQSDAIALMDVERLLDRRMLTTDTDPAALAAEIANLPRAAADPYSKASAAGLHMGVITHPSPHVTAILAAARVAIDDYIATPHRQDSAFIAAAPAYATMKAWTVTLHAGGQALPHNHPSGWLSGVYYVSAPDVHEAAGALLVPLPSPGSGDAPWRPQVLVPRAGELILFPSYYRHRTLPHDSPEARISIAFDIVPVERPG